MSEQQPELGEESSVVDTLYLDLEHFVLTAEAQPPLEPKERVVSIGRPFPGLLPSAGPVRPDSGELIPHNEDECGWEEGCRCLCRECQGRPGEEPTR